MKLSHYTPYQKRIERQLVPEWQPGHTNNPYEINHSHVCSVALPDVSSAVEEIYRFYILKVSYLS